MSIQRYDTEDPMYPMDGGDAVYLTWREGKGLWVRYDDHVAAMQAEAESAHDLGVIYGINHERARIKALIASLEYDGDYCKVLHSCDLLSGINGDL